MTSTIELIQSEHRAAQAAMREGRLREAHRHCQAILQADRRHADAWFLCGVIAAHNHQFDKALQIIGNALALDPDNAEYRTELAKQQLATGALREALQSALAALALQPTSVPVLNTLGTVLSHCGEHDKAVRCYTSAAQALDKASDDTLSTQFRAEFHFNMATSLQFAGRFEEARSAFDNAIALRPDYFRAHSALSAMTRSGDSQRLATLEALHDRVNSPRDRLHLGHALAAELEAMGRYLEAMSALAWAKEGQARAAGYRRENDSALFAALRETFDSQQMRLGAGSGCDNAEAIFIVGMPRTGTTLVEQILGGHSRVYPAGELQQFPRAVKQLAASSSLPVLDIETVQSSASLDMRQLGRAYIDSTRPRTGDTEHFIDKLPLNFMYLGLIHLALPNAKVICLRRDPMDTCLSNYRQLFATNFLYYHYNYDLLDCGHYYLLFDQLMAHWKQLMPDSLFELQYETLVNDPQAQVRSLLEFCGLPWEEACLDYHRREGSVATPSAVQVRQGIYTDSVDRWRRYGDSLQPLFNLLQRAGLYD